MSVKSANVCVFKPEIGRTQYWMRVAVHLEKLTGNRYGISYIREIQTGARLNKKLQAHIKSAREKTESELKNEGIRVREL